ncbi:MAG: hypothetical protein DRQ55_05825 [Planctomycetota bacterium]|nr:MAG: hypothetical protein DRQ55_05825 [Planctomycetota bacterium]
MPGRLIALTLVVCGVVVACSAPSAPVDLGELDALAQQQELLNLGRPYPSIWTAGQITERQMAVLAESGMTVFISLRQAHEPGAGWEQQLAQELGVRFLRLPIAGGADVNWQSAGELHDLLAEAGDEPLLLYGSSSNRVGALLALRANGSLGLSPDEALLLGRQAGMTRLEPVVARHLKR